MTREQAESLVSRIFARFPRAQLTTGVLSAWAADLENFEYDYAARTLRGPILGYQSDYPPPLNALRSILLSGLQPPEEPYEEPTRNQRQIVSDYRKIINFIEKNAEKRIVRNWRKLQPGDHRKILERRLLEKYGPRWEYRESWVFDEDGSVRPRQGTLSKGG